MSTLPHTSHTTNKPQTHGEHDAETAHQSLRKSLNAQLPDIASEKSDAAANALSQGARQVMRHANHAAKATSSSFLAGMRAFKAVYKAKKQAQDAQNQLKELQTQLKTSTDSYERRVYIEQHYTQLVDEYTQTKEHEQTALASAQEKRNLIQDKCTQSQDALQAMKAKHKEELFPFRELMENTKGRGDDAAKALADARRLLKTNEQLLAAATKRRDQRIAAAQQSLDSAQERLQRIRAGIDQLNADPSCNLSVKTQMQSEAVVEKAHLDKAKIDLTRITSEAQEDISSASALVESSKKGVEVAEVQARALKQKADAHRSEYERLYKERYDKEQALQAEITAMQTTLEALDGDITKATQTIAQQEKKLDEAHDVHATPELTKNLHAQIQQETQLVAGAKARAEKLERRAQAIVQHTRRYRLISVLCIIVAVLIVIGVVWLIRTSMH